MSVTNRIIDSGDKEAFVFNNKVLEELIRNIYLKEVDVVNDIALAPWHEFWRSFNEATDKGIRLAGFNEDDRGFYRELRYNNGVFAAFRTHRLQNDIARQLLDEKGELKPFERFAYDVRNADRSDTPQGMAADGICHGGQSGTPGGAVAAFRGEPGGSALPQMDRKYKHSSGRGPPCVLEHRPAHRRSVLVEAPSG